MSEQKQAISLKEWAYIAIAKHSRKIFKYESKVPQDKNPENLHQMRVGMRRLRSAISGLVTALDLPPAVTQRNIAKIGHILGELRDLDVLLATLKSDYRPLLPKKEQKRLDKAIASLEKKRKKAVKKVRKTLDSKRYRNLQQGIQMWLEKPQYLPIGDLSIYFVLSDLLLPQVSHLLLHPGWLIGIEMVEGKVEVPESLTEKTVMQILEQQEPILHDLRKEAKRTRYNLELFSKFYGDTYSYYLKQIEQVQEVLGHIQDCYVLKEVLEDVLKSAIAEKMPELNAIFTQTRYQKWQEWSALQEEFLDEKTRIELRQSIQQPKIEKDL